MPFLLCNILFAFPLFLHISSLVFCTSPWILCLKIGFMLIFMQVLCGGFFLFCFDLWDFSQKTTCCFLQSDVLFFIKRRVVFIKMTCCFLCTLWGEETTVWNAIQKPRFWIVKKSVIAPSRVRTRSRASQEFFSFCCHKCHTVIRKPLLFSLLCVFFLYMF